MSCSGVVTRAAGARDCDGHFPEGSVNALVEAQLAAFAEDVRRFSLEHATSRIWKRQTIAS